MPKRRRFDPWKDGKMDPGAADEGAANARTVLLYAKSRAEARKAMLSLVDTYEKRMRWDPDWMTTGMRPPPRPKKD